MIASAVWLTFDWDGPEGEIFEVDARYRVIPGLPQTRTEPAEEGTFELVKHEVKRNGGFSFPPDYEEALLEFLESPDRWPQIEEALGEEADGREDY